MKIVLRTTKDDSEGVEKIKSLFGNASVCVLHADRLSGIEAVLLVCSLLQGIDSLHNITNSIVEWHRERPDSRRIIDPKTNVDSSIESEEDVISAITGRDNEA